MKSGDFAVSQMPKDFFVASTLPLKTKQMFFLSFLFGVGFLEKVDN
jgi:hypothetical protein